MPLLKWPDKSNLHLSTPTQIKKRVYQDSSIKFLFFCLFKHQNYKLNFGYVLVFLQVQNFVLTFIFNAQKLRKTQVKYSSNQMIIFSFVHILWASFPAYFMHVVIVRKAIWNSNFNVNLLAYLITDHQFLILCERDFFHEFFLFLNQNFMFKCTT